MVDPLAHLPPPTFPACGKCGTCVLVVREPEIVGGRKSDSATETKRRYERFFLISLHSLRIVSQEKINAG